MSVWLYTRDLLRPNLSLSVDEKVGSERAILAEAHTDNWAELGLEYRSDSQERHDACVF